MPSAVSFRKRKRRARVRAKYSTGVVCTKAELTRELLEVQQHRLRSHDDATDEGRVLLALVREVDELVADAGKLSEAGERDGRVEIVVERGLRGLRGPKRGVSVSCELGRQPRGCGDFGCE